MKIALVLGCLLAAAHAGLLPHAPPPPPPPPPQHEIIYDYVAPASYRFDYAVRDGHTGDAKTQWEHRDGDTVRGAYSLVDADGTTRIVEYTADPHNGFRAEVKRLGHPAPPPPQPKESYKSGTSKVLAPNPDTCGISGAATLA
ncbi:cuticle protein 7-like [Schistocerca piceifrons]|uniref:cuticle protein 7-like n=1 Tax=Schistocerca piceifrons TaxID=274613 RepID=UPI001F5FC5FA|nr:cuticle protein 7-like [Schistocerca piceifrons]